MIDRFRGITHILRQEASVSLGLAGRKLRAAVQALRTFDAGSAARRSATRAELLENAAYALSAYVIQREALGLRDHGHLDTEYDLTAEIWSSMGVVRPRERL